MKKILKMYNSDEFEIFCEGEDAVIKDKINQKYYETKTEEIKKIQDIALQNRISLISPKNFILYITLFLFLSVTNLYILFFSIDYKQTSLTSFTISLLVYFPIFIIIHELGHAFFLKLFKRSLDSFGFKFNYIFPSFYVRMNDTNLLAQNEKIVVHSGGLLFSLILNTFIFISGLVFHSQILIYIGKYMAFDILLNSVPILNSDGYKILITLFNVRVKKKKTSNSKIVNYINIINIIIVLLYTAFFIKNILL